MAGSSAVPVNGIARLELLDVWRDDSNKDNRTGAIYTYVVNKLQLDDSLEGYESIIKKKTGNICKQMYQKWQECHSSLNNLRSKYPQWLQGYFTFEDVVQEIRNTPTCSQSVGRPRTLFSESSELTKRRKIKPLLEVSPERLAFATQFSLRSQGLRTAAAIVKAVSETPEEALDLKKISPQNIPIKFTPDEALASFIKKKLTKSQYIETHLEGKQHNADIYPTYDDILSAKKRCYPEDISTTESSAEIPLQSLLDHTARRLVLVQKDVLLQYCTLGVGSTVTAVYKWGCDGAAGHQNYKQRYVEEEGTNVRHDDSFLFIVSCVPLRLIGNNDVILWQNQRPSSTAFCRPIKIIFQKETEQMVREEVAKIREQVSQLRETEVSIEGCNFIVTHSVHLTMIDGKICSFLTETPSSTCFICKANPKSMNDLESHSERILNPDAISFGMSSLHAWIKCFECILHISYRLNIRKWQVRNEDKDAVNTRKKYIQSRLRAEMGLLVDIPKPGYGTTNDGNTARKFFAKYKQAANITGVDEALIFRLSILLRTIACGLEIDLKKFAKYALETAQLYVSLYNWYYMPPTLHKLLVHGEEIIKSSIVPIGQMSEEAQEAKHKDLKRFRREHSRKNSRKATIEDMMHMALITSDPVISSLIRRPSKKSGPLPSEVIEMLTCAYTSNELEVHSNAESDENTDEDDSP